MGRMTSVLFFDRGYIPFCQRKPKRGSEASCSVYIILHVELSPMLQNATVAGQGPIPPADEKAMKRLKAPRMKNGRGYFTPATHSPRFITSFSSRTLCKCLHTIVTNYLQIRAPELVDRLRKICYDKPKSIDLQKSPYTIIVHHQ